MKLAGKFIVIDGPDGSGKGTQLDRLGAWLGAQSTPVVRARDPGGTVIGDRIRHVLLGYDLADMDPACEALLFMASRAQLVAEIVRPALARGAIVLCDRFISATCAYQVAAGFPRETVLALGQIAVGTTWPDLTIVLDVPPDVGFARTGRTPQNTARKARQAETGQLAMFAGARPDAMEARPLEFHRRVRALFHELPSVYPRPVVLVDATRPADEVATAVQQVVRDALG